MDWTKFVKPNNHVQVLRTHRIYFRVEIVYPLEGQEYKSSKEGYFGVIFLVDLPWENTILREYMEYINRQVEGAF